MIPYDQIWKDLLQKDLRDGLSLLFPQFEELIDWTREGECLSTEFQGALLPGSKRGCRVDFLVRLWLLNGLEQVLLLHIEIQNQKVPELEDRIYLYNARIYEMYRKKVVSLAILGDLDSQWKPSSFGYQMADFRLDFHFPVAKLVDFLGREEELLERKTPFAFAILAHLASIKSKYSPKKRLAYKIGLTRNLFKLGLSRERIDYLYQVIEMLLPLPRHEEEAYHMEMAKLKNTEEIKLVSVFEKRMIKKGFAQGVEKGIVEGIEKGQLISLKKLIHLKFGALPQVLITKLEDSSSAEIERYTERILVVNTIEELFSS